VGYTSYFPIITFRSLGRTPAISSVRRVFPRPASFSKSLGAGVFFSPGNYYGLSLVYRLHICSLRSLRNLVFLFAVSFAWVAPEAFSLLPSSFSIHYTPRVSIIIRSLKPFPRQRHSPGSFSFCVRVSMRARVCECVCVCVCVFRTYF